MIQVAVEPGHRGTIYVLDFGRLIFEGPPDEVMAAPIVQSAYLGTDSVGPLPATSVISTGVSRVTP